MATDYDPAKAHAYYMAHRQLTQRTSTAGLSAKAKEMAAYVKQQLKAKRDTQKAAIQAERKQKLAELSATTRADMIVLRSQIKDAKGNPQKVAELKGKLASMKANYTQQRASMVESYKAKYQKVKDDYNNQYASELSKLRGA